MKITEQQIEAAVQQLRRSERGQGAAQHVLDFLNGDGLGLDAENQRAVLTLIVGAWQGYPQTVRDALQYGNI